MTATEFVKPLNDATGKEYDESVALECVISNELVPCQWFKGDEPVVHGPKYEIIDDKKTKRLIVHDVRPEDSGNFRCVVGDNESSATLDVKGTWELLSFHNAK